MKYLLALTALITAICHPVGTLAQSFDLDGTTARAVVVGISDYQDAAISDLRFADKDAEAFANFLRSPAGGSLDGDHLKLLTNEQATAGRIAEALDGLIEQAKEGDEVIIYFSGHGDVEGKKISQPGFLLCWDAPPRVYMGGGTYSLSFLQEVVSTLSVQNKAKVVVITDACHAGKLAGNQIGGAQLTSANLAKQYANELKILSCQPNEFSLEGEQWGGGRGAFSYHLIDGLYGLADRNADGSVTLGEIDRYLEDHVTAEAAPQSQVPMLLGNKTDRLATVNAAALADLQKQKSGQAPVLTAIASRGFEDDVLAKVDSSIQEMYRAFKLAVEEKRFLEPAGNCAEDYYTQLVQIEGLTPLRGIMKRNYAAALQDDAQQVLNEWLKGQTAESKKKKRLMKKAFKDKLHTFPPCLDRAAELLGKGHYMYPSLKARSCFFEGYLLANITYDQVPNKELGNKALGLFRKSLEWEPEQPQVYWQMSLVFGYILLQNDSAASYARQAIRINPLWMLPYMDVVQLLCWEFSDQDEASHFLDMAEQVDSNSLEVMEARHYLYIGQNQWHEAARQAEKIIAKDSTYINGWESLGWIYLQNGRNEEAVQVLKRALTIDSTYAWLWENLGLAYNNLSRYAEAEHCFIKAIELEITSYNSWGRLAYSYNQTGRYAEAVTASKKAISINSTQSWLWEELFTAYTRSGQIAEAETALNNAVSVEKNLIALDSSDVAPLQQLGYLYKKAQRYAEAEAVLTKALTMDPKNTITRSNLGMVYFKTARPEEARKEFAKALEIYPVSWSAHLGMARLLAAEGKTEEALRYVEEVLQTYMPYQRLADDPDLALLRELPPWKALMKKYFPEQIKD